MLSASKANAPRRISGTIGSISHHNPKDGFTIATILLAGSKATVKGRIAGVRVGLQLDCSAVPETDPAMIRRWGPSYKITSVAAERDADDAFCPDLESIGVPRRRHAAILEAMGKRAAALVRENPYRLASMADGMPFGAVDRIASSLGVKSEDPRRISAGVAFALSQEASQRGHVGITRTALRAEVARLLECDPKLATKGIAQALRDGTVVEAVSESGLIIARADMVGDEEEIARRLTALSRTRGMSRAQALAAVAKGAAKIGRDLTERQREAAVAALTGGVTILTGGPGTGKTTTLATILASMGRDARHVRLCAPAGKAAQRMSEQTRHPAHTIHSLLGIGADDEELAGGDKMDGARLVIADEASMIDVNLMASLCRTLPEGCRLMIVGDPEQLPSIGPGSVLSDLIRSGAVTVVRLDAIHRQGEGSAIVAAARDIREGRYPAQGADFAIVETDSDAETGRAAIEASDGATVLCPIKRGPAGVNALNAALQSRAGNGEGPGVETRARADRPAWTWRAGDAALNVRNNKKAKLVNGDVGTVTRVNPQSGTVWVSFPGRSAPVAYDNLSLDDLIPAYAMTIHKSQGSEYDRVVIAVPESSSDFFSKMMLYTAVTRGARHVTLVGPRRAIEAAIANATQAQRNTTLRAAIAA